MEELMGRMICLASITMVLVAGPVLAQDRIDLKVVKYDELGRMVKEARGKVVVVDLWALW